MSFDRCRRTSDPWPVLRPVPALALMLSALALLWQALVVQTHVHAPVAPGASAGAAPAAENRRPDDASATCSLCQALAQTGSYVPPDGIAIATPAPAFGMAAAAPFAARIALRPPQGWRNRGPPVSRA